MLHESRVFVAILVSTLTGWLPPASGAVDLAECGDLTFDQCFTKLIQAEPTLADTATSAEVKEKQKKSMERQFDSLLSSSDVAGAASSARDHLTSFLAAIGFDGVSEDEGTLILRFPGLINVDGALDISGSLAIRDPEPFAPFIEKIPEAQRQGIKAAIENEQEDFDDLTAGLTVSVTAGRFARNWFTLTRLFAAADTAFATLKSGQKDDAQVALLAEIGNLGSFDLEQGKLGELPSAQQGRLFDKMREAVAELVVNEERLQETLQETQILQFDKLVANQPQLYFTFESRSREEEAGPDEWSIKANYEQGFVNVNGLYRDCGGEAALDLPCVAAFMEKYEGSSKWQHRFKVALQYGEIDAYSRPIPGDEKVFSLDKVRKRIGSVTYGAPLRLDEDKKPTLRFDLEAKYEDVTGDRERNDRFVATATFTQKVSGTATLAYGLVYANEPEYLGEVDEELSAQLGLKYSLHRKKK